MGSSSRKLKFTEEGYQRMVDRMPDLVSFCKKEINIWMKSGEQTIPPLYLYIMDVAFATGFIYESDIDKEPS